MLPFTHEFERRRTVGDLPAPIRLPMDLLLKEKNKQEQKTDDSDEEEEECDCENCKQLKEHGMQDQGLLQRRDHTYKRIDDDEFERKQFSDTKNDNGDGDDDSDYDSDSSYDAYDKLEENVLDTIPALTRLSRFFQFDFYTEPLTYNCHVGFWKDRKCVFKIKALESESNFPKEVQILVHLKGLPNIPELLDWFIIENCYVTVVPYYESHSLKEIWDDEYHCKTYMRNLLTCVKLMHNKGVLYRDIKPSNIVYNKNTEMFKIIDFDVATFYRPKVGHSVYAGTDVYMAPEMKTGKYFKEIDEYACGVILGQLIHKIGESKLEFKDIKEWRTQQDSSNKKKKKKKNNGGGANGKHYLLKRLLEKIPTKRISATKALEDKWLHA